MKAAGVDFHVFKMKKQSSWANPMMFNQAWKAIRDRLLFESSDYFFEVDPRVVTKLFLCPLCFCKLAYRKDAENHVFVHHKIDAATFQDLNLSFGVMEV